MVKSLSIPLCFVVISLLAAGDEAAQAPAELTAAERTAARALAEQALKARDLLRGKVYLTRIEVFPDSRGAKRHAIVTHYRYDGDLGIRTAIDLDRKEVTAVETIPHLPTSLAPEEVAEADRLARADPVVARALARYAGMGKIEVDAVIVSTVIPDDPRFHHRTVRLAFRRGREYLLYAPFVEVDLTTGTVRADRIATGHD